MASVETPMPTDPNSTAQNYGSLRRMAGGDDGGQTSPDQGQSGQEDPQRALANVTNTLRECDEKIMSVAGSNPKVAKQVRDVRQAISRLTAALVSNPGGSEAPAPRSGY